MKLCTCRPSTEIKSHNWSQAEPQPRPQCSALLSVPSLRPLSFQTRQFLLHALCHLSRHLSQPWDLGPERFLQARHPSPGPVQRRASVGGGHGPGNRLLRSPGNSSCGSVPTLENVGFPHLGDPQLRRPRAADQQGSQDPFIYLSHSHEPTPCPEVH